jgi:hypothetical protein
MIETSYRTTLNVCTKKKQNMGEGRELCTYESIGYSVAQLNFVVDSQNSCANPLNICSNPANCPADDGSGNSLVCPSNFLGGGSTTRFLKPDPNPSSSVCTCVSSFY